MVRHGASCNLFTFDFFFLVCHFFNNIFCMILPLQYNAINKWSKMRKKKNNNFEMDSIPPALKVTQKGHIQIYGSCKWWHNTISSERPKHIYRTSTEPISFPSNPILKAKSLECFGDTAWEIACVMLTLGLRLLGL